MLPTLFTAAPFDGTPRSGSLSDKKGDTTKFVYDLNDNRIETISFTGDTSRNRYTSNGNDGPYYLPGDILKTATTSEFQCLGCIGRH